MMQEKDIALKKGINGGSPALTGVRLIMHWVVGEVLWVEEAYGGYQVSVHQLFPYFHCFHLLDCGLQYRLTTDTSATASAML